MPDKAEKKAPDTQPAHFPMPFDEWGGMQASGWRFLVAAFRHEVRVKGQLQHQRLATEWSADFEAFKSQPTGGGR